MNQFYSKRKLLLSSVFMMFILTSASKAQSFLEIPIKLEVEKGDMNDIVVKVRKDGKDAFTQSGAGKMRFKFDYNRKYSLIFTKPGYVTKTIEINTAAPSARISQGFDPYKIGVKLFKQGEENTIVYNQPVAHIKYDQNLDEFNFDTDYSKSILSAMDQKDDEDKKEDIPVAKDDQSKTLTSDNNVTATTPPPAEEKTPVPALASTSNAEPAIIENPKSPVIAQQTESPQPPPMSTGNENPDPAKMNSGEEAKKTGVISTGDDQKKTASASISEDKPKKAAASSGEDLFKKATTSSGEDKSKKASMSSGSETSKKSGSNADNEKPAKRFSISQGEENQSRMPTASSGIDQQGTPAGFMESEKITREDIIERNRVITKVRVMKGNLTTEYSRVNYKWGGLFFFKNASTSIPENLFVQWTGVSRDN